MIIVALDFPDANAALLCVDKLGEHVTFYKIGLQLFTREGPAIVRQLKDRDKRVFLDLKFHDIPNTVAGAVASASRLDVDMLTVHASGGAAMIRAAVDSAASASHPPLVLAVTVLTSMDASALAAIGVATDATSHVIRLAGLAKEAGCGGFVCSPQEVEPLRQQIGDDLKLVVPGIRPAGTATDDQARIATPQDAIRAGADYLVIGRPITAAPDPLRAVRAIMSEVASVRRG